MTWLQHSRAYRELERSLVGLGEFKLVDDFRQFYVPMDVWTALPDDTKRHMTRFMKCKRKRKTTVTSTDSNTSCKPGNGGAKPGTKRKRGPKTKTSSKKIKIS